MRLNSGQPASERRTGVNPRPAVIRGVEAGATTADIQTTASIEQLLPLNPANRRIRTRTYGGVGGEEPRGSPLSRSLALSGSAVMSDLSPECSPKRPSVDHLNLSVWFSLQPTCCADVQRRAAADALAS